MDLIRTAVSPTRRRRTIYTALASTAGAAALMLAAVPAVAVVPQQSLFVGPHTTVSEIGSTVPPNGDVNPYGVAVVHHTIGTEVAGDVLVSNFNSGPGPSGLQGLGTTIVQLDPDAASGATPRVFAQIDPGHLPGSCPGGVGLTTALSILPGGWVVVGSLPTSNGTTVSGAGCLLVLDDTGHVVETFSGGPINGPWDMTSTSYGRVSDLYFTNVLNGTVHAAGNTVDQGTVVRAVLRTPLYGPPKLVATTVIASGLPETLNSSALVIGPTGLAVSRDDDSLFVADTLDNRIVDIPFAATRLHSAGEGVPFSTGGELNGPLGLATTPRGNLLAANGGDGNLVEISVNGVQLGEKTISPGGAGALFGLAVADDAKGVYFVDDSENQLNIVH